MATATGLTIAIVSSTDANPISIVATGHGRTTGDKVSIAGHLVNTRANGERTITVVDVNTFTLDSSGAVTGSGAGGATGTVTTYANSVTIPADGDGPGIKAADVNPGFEGALDNAQLLYEDFKQRMLGIFPVVPGVSVTRAQHGTPFAKPSEWAVNSSGVWVCATTSSTLRVPMSLPNGATWTGFKYTVKEANAGSVAPINVGAVKMLLSTGAYSSIASLSYINDPAPSTSAHQVTHVSGAELVDTTLYAYFLEIIGESDTVGDVYYGSSATFTTHAIDAGAA